VDIGELFFYLNMLSTTRERKTFSTYTSDAIEPPHALSMQLDSYKWFCEEGLG
jgi:hypothetical protein